MLSGVKLNLIQWTSGVKEVGAVKCGVRFSLAPQLLNTRSVLATVFHVYRLNKHCMVSDFEILKTFDR